MNGLRLDNRRHRAAASFSPSRFADGRDAAPPRRLAPPRAHGHPSGRVLRAHHRSLGLCWVWRRRQGPSISARCTCPLAAVSLYRAPPRVWLERQGASRMTKGGTSSTAAVTGPTLLIDDLFCPSNTLRYRGGAGRLTTGPLWARLHVGLFLASTISLSCGGNTQRTLFAHLMNGSGSSKSLSDACSRAVRRPETPALRFALSAGRRALIARAGVLISASCREPYRPPAPVARAAQDCVRRAF